MQTIGEDIEIFIPKYYNTLGEALFQMRTLKEEKIRNAEIKEKAKKKGRMSVVAKLQEEKRILEFVKNSTGKTIIDICKFTNKSRSTIRQTMVNLKRKGVIKRELMKSTNEYVYY
jgi:predicted HTH transcriptional regulator